MKNLTDKKAVKRFIKLTVLHTNAFNRILEFTEHRLLLDDMEKHVEIISEAEEYICDSIFNLASSCFGLIEYGQPQGFAFNKKLLNLQRELRNALNLLKKGHGCKESREEGLHKESRTEKLYEILNHGPNASRTHQLKNFLKPASTGSKFTQDQ
jgi:hypothetical protein